jgi:hypothetical protein
MAWKFILITGASLLIISLLANFAIFSSNAARSAVSQQTAQGIFPNPDAPTCVLTAKPTIAIIPGQIIKLSWSTEKAGDASLMPIYSVDLFESITSVPVNGSTTTVANSYSIGYQLSVSNAHGSATCVARLRVLL